MWESVVATSPEQAEALSRMQESVLGSATTAERAADPANLRGLNQIVTGEGRPETGHERDGATSGSLIGQDVSGLERDES